MNQLWNLVKKECRELLTPATLASVIAVCVILILIGNVVGGEVHKATNQAKPIGLIVDTESEGYSKAGVDQIYCYYENVLKVKPEDYIKRTSQPIAETDTGAILQFMKDNNVDTCLLIPADYNVKLEAYVQPKSTTAIPQLKLYYNQVSTTAFSALSTVTGTTTFAQFNQGVTYALMDQKHISKEEAKKILTPSLPNSTTYFKDTPHENTTPDQITGAMSAQSMFVPMIIMLIIVMIGSILISSMGNEKENKTLETLLTLPISRTTVVAGKLLGCAIAGLVMGAIYMVGMYFYISSFSSAASGGKSLQELGLALNGFDWVLVALFVFLAIMCALGLCMILGAFAKNNKAAQMYVMPISILAVIPMFVTMFSSFTSLPAVIQGLLFLIPFTHPMMIIPNIMMGNWTLIIAGGIYLVIFAAVTMFITVKLYNSDILLTGWLKKDDGKKKGFSLSDIFKKSKN